MILIDLYYKTLQSLQKFHIDFIRLVNLKLGILEIYFLRHATKSYYKMFFSIQSHGHEVLITFQWFLTLHDLCIEYNNNIINKPLIYREPDKYTRLVVWLAVDNCTALKPHNIIYFIYLPAITVVYTRVILSSCAVYTTQNILCIFVGKRIAKTYIYRIITIIVLVKKMASKNIMYILITIIVCVRRIV